jgi:1-aminocyclopropane-1-carboxylate deaminase
MELIFVNREAYKDKEKIKQQYSNKDLFWIDEGGYGITGMMGAKEILKVADTSSYSHIICACGTGTTLAGLVEAALQGQLCIGVNALKGYHNLKRDVMDLLPATHQDSFEVLNEYHFGGYAKYNGELLNWMNELWSTEKLPTDFVYTAKLFYAVKDLISKKYFSVNNKLLVIHSGGLQGNRSLSTGRLQFL